MPNFLWLILWPRKSGSIVPVLPGDCEILTRNLLCRTVYLPLIWNWLENALNFAEVWGFFLIFLPSDTYKQGQSCCINECFYFLGHLMEISPWVGLESWKKKCDLGNRLQLIHALDSVVCYNQSIPSAEPDASPGSDNKCVPDRPWADKAPYEHSSCFVCNKLWKCRGIFLC